MSALCFPSCRAKFPKHGLAFILHNNYSSRESAQDPFTKKKIRYVHKMCQTPLEFKERVSRNIWLQLQPSLVNRIPFLPQHFSIMISEPDSRIWIYNFNLNLLPWTLRCNWDVKESTRPRQLQVVNYCQSAPSFDTKIVVPDPKSPIRNEVWCLLLHVDPFIPMRHPLQILICHSTTLRMMFGFLPFLNSILELRSNDLVTDFSTNSSTRKGSLNPSKKISYIDVTPYRPYSS